MLLLLLLLVLAVVLDVGRSEAAVMVSPLLPVLILLPQRAHLFLGGLRTMDGPLEQLPRLDLGVLVVVVVTVVLVRHGCSCVYV